MTQSVSPANCRIKSFPSGNKDDSFHFYEIILCVKGDCGVSLVSRSMYPSLWSSSHNMQCSAVAKSSFWASVLLRPWTIRTSAVALVLLLRSKPPTQVSNENSKETLIITMIVGSLGSPFFFNCFQRRKKRMDAKKSSFQGASANSGLFEAARSSHPP